MLTRSRTQTPSSNRKLRSSNKGSRRVLEDRFNDHNILNKDQGRICEPDRDNDRDCDRDGDCDRELERERDNDQDKEDNRGSEDHIFEEFENQISGRNSLSQIASLHHRLNASGRIVSDRDLKMFEDLNRIVKRVRPRQACALKSIVEYLNNIQTNVSIIMGDAHMFESCLELELDLQNPQGILKQIQGFRKDVEIQIERMVDQVESLKRHWDSIQSELQKIHKKARIENRVI